jgi:hypothetical protein
MEIVEVHVVQAMQITYRLIKLDQTHSGPPALLGLLDVALRQQPSRSSRRPGLDPRRDDQTNTHPKVGVTAPVGCMVDYGS